MRFGQRIRPRLSAHSNHQHNDFGHAIHGHLQAPNLENKIKDFSTFKTEKDTNNQKLNDGSSNILNNHQISQANSESSLVSKNIISGELELPNENKDHVSFNLNKELNDEINVFAEISKHNNEHKIPPLQLEVPSLNFKAVVDEKILLGSNHKDNAQKHVSKHTTLPLNLELPNLGGKAILNKGQNHHHHHHNHDSLSNANHGHHFDNVGQLNTEDHGSSSFQHMKLPSSAFTFDIPVPTSNNGHTSHFKHGQQNIEKHNFNDLGHHTTDDHSSSFSQQIQLPTSGFTFDIPVPTSNNGHTSHLKHGQQNIEKHNFNNLGHHTTGDHSSSLSQQIQLPTSGFTFDIPVPTKNNAHTDILKRAQQNLEINNLASFSHDNIPQSSNTFSLPAGDYLPPVNEYLPPSNDYLPPKIDYLPPSDGYLPPRIK